MLCVVLNVVDFEMDVRQAVDAPRLHHGWFPDRTRVETALTEEHAEAIDGLRKLGHDVQIAAEAQGDAHTIYVEAESNELIAAPDRRISGSAAGY